MSINRKDLVQDIIQKISKTDFIATRVSAGEVPDSWAAKGFSWDEWKAYREALRGIIKVVQEMSPEGLDPNTITWPIMPTFPRVGIAMDKRELIDHIDNMKDNYNVDLTNIGIYTID